MSQPDRERQRMAREYARATRRLWLATTGLSAAYVLAWLLLGWGTAVRTWLVEAWPPLSSPWLLVPAFAAIFAGPLAVLELPLGFYGGYVLPHRYGLSTQTLKGWMVDQGKGLLIGAPLGLVLVVGFSRAASAGVVAFCVVGLMAWNVYFYFEVYTPRNTYARATAATELAFDLRDRRSSFFAYMFTPPALYLNYGTFQYIAERPPGIDVNEPLTSVTALPTYPPNLRPVFIFIPSRIGELALIKERFPTGQLITRVIPGETEQILYYIYEPTQ